MVSKTKIMKKVKSTIFSGLIFCLLVIGMASCKNPKTSNGNDTESELTTSESGKNNKENGFKPLFNGKDFEGWELLLRDGTPEEAQKVYTIDNDGVLHFFRDLPEGSGSEIRKNAFHGVMATKKSYSMYQLKFEYKWGKKLVNNYRQFQYDAGVFYQITNLKVFPTGLQYQIRYNHEEDRNHTGDFWVTPGKNMQWYSVDGITFTLPSEGGLPQPIKKGEHRVKSNTPYHGLDDEWNQCELIVMGDDYAIHKLNGKLVNMATNLSTGNGPIALEAETGEIFWRNIMIKEYEKPLPMKQFLK
jgi:hypothetical protein